MSAAVAALDATEATPDAGGFSFEWFSSLPNYRATNRMQLESFLADLRLPSPWQGIDVACGVGLMSELCHEVAGKIGAFIQRTVCVDLDRQALEIARKNLARYPVSFFQALGQRLPLRDGAGSYLVLGNGIHMFGAEDKRDLFQEASRVLKSGASIFFNSAFYEGAIVEGTEQFYVDKVFRTVRRIVRSGNRGRADGGERPEARTYLTADEYVELAEEAGFRNAVRHEADVLMDQELWEAIADYSGYALGAVHYKYPAEVVCPAMREAVRDLFQAPEFETKYGGVVEAGKRYIPRRWLWVTARKP
jgi:ubiquinone/menaquinone biosynthesis C-methylase UbiE